MFIGGSAVTSVIGLVLKNVAHPLLLTIKQGVMA